MGASSIRWPRNLVAPFATTLAALLSLVVVLIVVGRVVQRFERDA